MSGEKGSGVLIRGNLGQETGWEAVGTAFSTRSKDNDLVQIYPWANSGITAANGTPVVCGGVWTRELSSQPRDG